MNFNRYVLIYLTVSHLILIGNWCSGQSGRSSFKGGNEYTGIAGLSFDVVYRVRYDKSFKTVVMKLNYSPISVNPQAGYRYKGTLYKNEVLGLTDLLSKIIVSSPTVTVDIYKDSYKIATKKVQLAYKEDGNGMTGIFSDQITIDHAETEPSNLQSYRLQVVQLNSEQYNGSYSWTTFEALIESYERSKDQLAIFKSNRTNGLQSFNQKDYDSAIKQLQAAIYAYEKISEKYRGDLNIEEIKKYLTDAQRLKKEQTSNSNQSSTTTSNTSNSGQSSNSSSTGMRPTGTSSSNTTSSPATNSSSSTNTASNVSTSQKTPQQIREEQRLANERKFEELQRKLREEEHQREVNRQNLQIATNNAILLAQGGNFLDAGVTLGTELANQGHTDAAIGAVAVGTAVQIGTAIFNDIQERREEKERQEQMRLQELERKRLQEEYDKKIALAKAEEERLELERKRIEAEMLKLTINNRKMILEEYQTSIPLTSQSKSESLFFFSVSMNAGFSTEKQVKQYISNVFEISKYKDGTRPYTSTILNELKDLTPYDEVICGYYNTEDEAIVARDNFIKEMQKEHVAFEEFYYAGKPSNMNMQGTNQNNSSANKGYGKVINVDSGHSSEPDIKKTNETPKNENKYGKTISFD